MSGGRFLVSLTEVTNSEKILLLRSMLKKDMNFWEYDVDAADSDHFNHFRQVIEDEAVDITGSSLSPESEEVSYLVAGYIGRKVLEKLSCQECCKLFFDESNANSSPYFDLLSRGGLLAPSEPLAKYVSGCFSILDVADTIISHHEVPVRQAAEYVLKRFGGPLSFACAHDRDKILKSSSRVIVNIYYNNKQKLVNASIRKDDVKEFKTRQRKKS